MEDSHKGTELKVQELEGDSSHAIVLANDDGTDSSHKSATGDMDGDEAVTPAGAPTTKWEHEPYYTLSGSVWDATILLGSDAFGTPGKIVAWGGIVLNVAMQTVFVYIVMAGESQLTVANYDSETVADFKNWRRRVAHHIDNMDPISQKSLASRV